MCRYMDVYEHVCLYAGGHVCASMCTYLEGIVQSQVLELSTLFAGLSIRLGRLASKLQDVPTFISPTLLVTSRSHTPGFYMASGIMLVRHFTE